MGSESNFPTKEPARRSSRKFDSDPDFHRLGLISDTHGLLRAEVHAVFRGVDMILHAGDVGGDEILDELALLAPVRAVYGNTDEPGNPRLVASIDIMVGNVRIHVSHGHELGVPKPDTLLARYAADVIVYGHTHKQLVTRAGGTLVVNPGAAGPARFDLKPSVALLEIRDGSADVRIVDL
ncbi:MAG TPA: metallophosphoesterase family protein [Gemmatimonadaceae bacterium]